MEFCINFKLLWAYCQIFNYNNIKFYCCFILQRQKLHAKYLKINHCIITFLLYRLIIVTLILYHLIIEQIMFQKYLSFLLLAIWRWNSDQGNSIFLSTFCGAWLNKVKVYWFFGRSIQNFHAIQGYQTFAGQWKTVTLLPVWLALFAIERSIVVTIIT